MRAARSAPSLPLPCHSLGAGMPRCSGSQDRQVGEQPELRGQAAAQVVALKLPARGAPERDHWGIGDECRGRQVRRARFPYVSPHPPCSPPSYPATVWRGGVPRCGGSQVRQRGEIPELRWHAAAQVVVAKDPARRAPERDHGGTATDAEGGKCDARDSPTRRHPPPPPTPYSATAWRRGCQGAAAHR